MSETTLPWSQILRLGLVQTALGAVVVLMTATLNRVMIVELALPALAPGLLIATLHGVQIFRPAWGYRSDIGGRRAPWIIFGMATLAIGGVIAAAGTAWATRTAAGGLAVAALGFLLVGAGAGAAGTNVLATLAAQVAPARRAAAATMVWVMMIFGFALTAPLAGHFLDPFSPARLVAVVAVVCGLAFFVACLAIWGVETSSAPGAASRRPQFSRRLPSSLVGAAGAPLHDLHFRLDARLQRAGTARRTLCGSRLRLGAGGHHQARRPPARRRARRHDPRWGSAPRRSAVPGSAISGCGPSAAVSPRRRRSWRLAAAGLQSAGAEALRLAVFCAWARQWRLRRRGDRRDDGIGGAGRAPREGTRMGLWGAAQALALGAGGLCGSGAGRSRALRVRLAAERLYPRLRRTRRSPSSARRSIAARLDGDARTPSARERARRAWRCRFILREANMVGRSAFRRRRGRRRTGRRRRRDRSRAARAAGSRCSTRLAASNPAAARSRRA